MTKHLVVGLGNPEAAYAGTRHNVGSMVLDRIAEDRRVAFHTDRLAEVAQCVWRGQRIHLIKPTTYMNHSGKAVRYWMGQLRVSLPHVLVVVDDLSLPFGKLRLRSTGGSAGHNGLRSIETLLHTQTYSRLRVGIGASFPQGKQAEFVLSAFSCHEASDLPAVLSAASDVVHSCCVEGVAVAMNRHNGSPNALSLAKA